MTNMGSPDGPPVAEDGIPPPLTHMSYSSFTNFLRCGKAYELARILGLPEQPSWWSIGGRAVHEATEQLDRERYAQTGD